MNKNQILALYRELRRKYGHPAGQWKLWCKRPKSTREKEEVIIGAVLTQRTAWQNVERAIGQLKKAGAASLQKIYRLGKTNPRKLGKLIKPSGFYLTKARYLFGIARFFVASGGVAKVSKMSLSDLRFALLQIPGVGPETTDSILLYALGKPVFVIDEYTRRLLERRASRLVSAEAERAPLRAGRLVKRKRFARKPSYDALQKLFESNIPRNFRLYQDFHALIVIEGKKFVEYPRM